MGMDKRDVSSLEKKTNGCLEIYGPTRENPSEITRFFPFSLYFPCILILFDIIRSGSENQIHTGWRL